MGAEAMAAQSTGNALSQAPQVALLAESPSSAFIEPQSPPDAGTKFEDILRIVQKEGSLTTIRKNLAQDLGLANSFNVDAPPVLAHALKDIVGDREISVIDDTGDVLFRTETDDTPVMYLANRAGVLQMAGRIKTGRFRSQSFQRIPKESAKAGFDAEKEFWMRRVSAMKDGKAVKAGHAISKPD